MANAQLRLVSEPAPDQNPDTQDDTRRVFEHWVFMFNRPVRRCKLGPTRRATIDAAMAMGYDTETLMLAIEGMAADPLANARDDGQRDAMREIEWFLARESRIERWAELGERLRARAERAERTPAIAQPEQGPVVSAEELAAAKARLKALANRMRAGQHG